MERLVCRRRGISPCAYDAVHDRHSLLNRGALGDSTFEPSILGSVMRAPRPTRSHRCNPHLVTGRVPLQESACRNFCNGSTIATTTTTYLKSCMYSRLGLRLRGRFLSQLSQFDFPIARFSSGRITQDCSVHGRRRRVGMLAGPGDMGTRRASASRRGEPVDWVGNPGIGLVSPGEK